MQSRSWRRATSCRAPGSRRLRVRGCTDHRSVPSRRSAPDRDQRDPRCSVHRREPGVRRTQHGAPGRPRRFGERGAVRGRLVAGMGGHPDFCAAAVARPTACRSSLCVRRTADGQRSCLRSKPSRHHDATSTSSSRSMVWLTCAASTTPNARTESSESPRPNIAPSSSMDSRRRRSTHDEPGRSGCHRHRRGPRAGTCDALELARQGATVVVNDLGVGIHGERESGGAVAVVLSARSTPPGVMALPNCGRWIPMRMGLTPSSSGASGRVPEDPLERRSRSGWGLRSGPLRHRPDEPNRWCSSILRDRDPQRLQRPDLAKVLLARREERNGIARTYLSRCSPGPAVRLPSAPIRHGTLMAQRGGKLRWRADISGHVEPWLISEYVDTQGRQTASAAVSFLMNVGGPHPWRTAPN